MWTQYWKVPDPSSLGKLTVSCYCVADFVTSSSPQWLSQMRTGYRKVLDPRSLGQLTVSYYCAADLVTSSFPPWLSQMRPGYRKVLDPRSLGQLTVSYYCVAWWWQAPEPPAMRSFELIWKSWDKCSYQSNHRWQPCLLDQTKQWTYGNHCTCMSTVGRYGNQHTHTHTHTRAHTRMHTWVCTYAHTLYVLMAKK